jgi:hypothetical protein
LQSIGFPLRHPPDCPNRNVFFDSFYVYGGIFDSPPGFFFYLYVEQFVFGFVSVSVFVFVVGGEVGKA